VLTVFIFLRAVGYPVSVIHVGWPPSWHRVGQARGWFFMEKARRAYAANRTAEAILYLSNAYEFDPANYAAGLTLAKTLQAGQPVVSNRLYERLLHEHPAQHEGTAQEWFRALLARGDFVAIQSLARDELLAASSHSSAWMRAFIFATRQGRHAATLRAFRDAPAPAAAVWQPLLDAELLTLAGHEAEARALVNGADWSRVPPYGIFYRISWLTEQGDALAALDLLGRNRAQLDDETRVTLQLAAYAQQGARQPLQGLVDQLLAPPLSPPVIKILAAQLIRYPDPPLLRQLYSRFRAAPIPVTTENAGVIFALLCAAGVNEDWPTFRAVGSSLTEQSGTTQAFLTAVEAFFRGRSNAARITSFLPALPMPLEVNYALIARYPGNTGPNLSTVGLPAKPAKRPP
jgi:tetratricopeptide (TPR) repeat protein